MARADLFLKLLNIKTKWFSSDNILYTLRKKYFREPFLVLQVVTNRGLYSVPGFLEGPNSTWKDLDRNLGVNRVLCL